jgi:hypothetical protein
MSEIVKKMISQLISGIGGSKSSSTSQPSVREDSGYYTWKKGDNISLSKYFSSKEFTCQCNFPDCQKQRISKALITKLDKVREEIKQPLIVTSAFRCHKHQAFLRSAGVNTVVAQVSQHELGNAADIVPKDQKDVRGSFLQICAKYFEAIGLSDRFLHVDLRSGRQRRWEY